MTLDAKDRALLDALRDGLPMVSRPYAMLGQDLGMDEGEVILRLRRMIERSVISRFGIVVRHHELGYRANAMVVWNLPDESVARIGQRMAGYQFVTLCYQRKRILPEWPYNLYCMIHGREKSVVLSQVGQLTEELELGRVQRDILFSRRRFKQRGAWYGLPSHPALEAAVT